MRHIQLAIPAANTSVIPSLARSLAAAGATLRAWRARDRERTELAMMDARERHDLAFARGFDIRREIAKPFWRE
jgi:uncharacterized protein YjiS (DUF1127 family)